MSNDSAEESFVTEVVQRDRISDAKHATNREHELTFLQAIRLYSRAVAWSVIMSSTLIMDGYDIKLIGSLFAQPQFVQAYGTLQANGSYEIPASWQSRLSNSSNITQMIGIAIGGYMNEQLGFRRTTIIALLLVPFGVVVQYSANNLMTLQLGQCILGVPLGMFQTVTTVYAVEVMPVCLRAHLAGYVNMCWLIGKFLASVVLRSVLNMSAPWAYRIPFAMQWMWPVPLLIGVYLAPESPWWLVRQNRFDEAKASIRRLTSRQVAHFNVDDCVALMALTTEHERKTSTDTQYSGCFRGIDHRRTFIVTGVYCTQVLSGSSLIAYVTYFFEQAGLPADQAFTLSIFTYGFGIVGVIVGWFLLLHMGRRELLLLGLSSTSVTLAGVGFLGVRQAASPSSFLSWSIGLLLLLTSLISYTMVGPITYSVVAEIPSSLLRSKSVAIARLCYSVLNIAANIWTLYQLNPSAWGWGARSGFFWGGTCLIGFLFVYFFVPEPKDRTIAELDLLFEKKVSARRFATARVDVLELLDEKQS